MFGWFKRASGGESDERRGPVPSLDSVRFDTAGLRHSHDEPGRRIWFSDQSDGVFLCYFDKPPDLPPRSSEFGKLRESLVSMIRNSPAKLVELSVVNLGPDELPAISVIVKGAQQPHGMTYLGSLSIPYRDFSFVVKVQCPETGLTGVREVVLFERLIGAGRISVITPPTISGDWNPDDAGYDAEFPQHPLSRLRAILRTVQQSCTIDPAIRGLPPWPLPPATPLAWQEKSGQAGGRS